MTCRAIQSAVGDGVMPTQRIRLRSCRRIRRPYSNLNEIVGTTKRSIEAIPSAWLRRNVLQPCEGGRLRRAMYLPTEVWPMSMPSLRSSPWMRGALQSGLARLCVPKTKSGRTGDGVRRGSGVIASHQLAEPGDVQVRPYQGTDELGLRYNSSRRRAADGADAPRCATASNSARRSPKTAARSSAMLQFGPRRHCLEAHRLALCERPNAGIQPSCWSPSRNAATRDCAFVSVSALGIRKPILRT